MEKKARVVSFLSRSFPRLSSAALCFALMAAAAGASEYTAAKVIGQRVNLRAKADLNAEVVGQLSNGDTVEVKSVQGEWTEIRPPESVDLWVSRDLVVDDKIIVNKANVRAGPGINYTVVGRIERGQPVQVRGSFGEWVKIAPFDDASLWVSTEFVQGPPTAASSPVAVTSPLAPVAPPSNVQAIESAPEVTAAPPAVETAVGEATSTPPPPAPQQPVKAPAGIDLVPLEGQGKTVEVKGELRPAPYLFSRPTPYRLTRREGGAYITVCYLRGNKAQLEGLRGKQLRITGRQFWAQGVREPIVTVDAILILRESQNP